jgi:hypothetical protein
MRLVVLVVIGIVTLGGAFLATRAANASPGSMSCSNPGTYTCDWGYNYQGPSTNEIVTGPNSYWTRITVFVSNGGTTYQGFGPSGCHHTSTGASSWGGSPSDLGCGGYINPFSQYHSDATSYLRFNSVV